MVAINNAQHPNIGMFLFCFNLLINQNINKKILL